MKDSFSHDYSERRVHFYDEGLSAVLRLGLFLAGEPVGKPRIADLGCGDGRLIFALYKRGLLRNADEVVGVDISESRIKRLANELPFVRRLISDALNVKELKKSSFDYVICSQLIEHVEDDQMLISEIRRLLKTRGLVYMSSVIKKRYGVYFYFKNGSFRLDPTHLREYSSVDEFVGLIASRGFEIIDVRARQIMYPLLDLFIRLLTEAGFVKANVEFYQQHKILNKVRLIQFPVFGYSDVEVLARKIG